MAGISSATNKTSAQAICATTRRLNESPSTIFLILTASDIKEGAQGKRRQPPGAARFLPLATEGDNPTISVRGQAAEPKNTVDLSGAHANALDGLKQFT